LHVAGGTRRSNEFLLSLVPDFLGWNFERD
jgi:hypothetical protein